MRIAIVAVVYDEDEYDPTDVWDGNVAIEVDLLEDVDCEVYKPTADGYVRCSYDEAVDDMIEGIKFRAVGSKILGEQEI